jgi:hypothetical protein
MFKRIYEFFGPQAEEVFARRMIWGPGMAHSMTISLVRFDGEFRVEFRLPSDPEAGGIQPFKLSADRLDELITYLQSCRDFVREPLMTATAPEPSPDR